MTQHKKLVIHSDGGARGNPGPAGAGGVIQNSSGNVLAEISEYLGETTNNIAEYKALILTLEKALQYMPEEMEIRADSELMVKQLLGEYKVKNEGLKPLFERVKQLLAGIKQVTIRHIYRQDNAHADELANKAIDEFAGSQIPETGPADQSSRQPDNMPEQGSLF